MPSLGIAALRLIYTAVSFAYSSASHLLPARLKLTCTRASAPLPSTPVITPSPNFWWNTRWQWGWDTVFATYLGTSTKSREVLTRVLLSAASMVKGTANVP